MKYPHMSARDGEIWEKYVQENPDIIDKVTYAVRVGNGMPLEKNWEPNIQKMAKELSQKRIDAVVEHADHIEIIEVKPRASFSALGQLLGYRQLYVEYYKTGKPIRLTVVCEYVSPDDLKLFQEHGILVREV